MAVCCNSCSASGVVAWSGVAVEVQDILEWSLCDGTTAGLEHVTHIALGSRQSAFLLVTLTNA